MDFKNNRVLGCGLDLFKLGPAMQAWKYDNDPKASIKEG
jgi:hypothetical protein